MSLIFLLLACTDKDDDTSPPEDTVPEEADADADADADSDADADADSDADTDVQACGGLSSTAQAWNLPEATGYSYTLWRGNANGGAVQWETLDVNGDGFMDLVVINDAADAQVPDSQWRVHLGSETGFSDTGTAWSLPTPLGDYRYDSLSGERGFEERLLAWDVLDLSGDGLVDLVMYQDSGDADMGVSHWKVYLGTAAGFSATATDWSLPLVGVSLNRLSGSQDGSSWALMDLDGDQTRELVFLVQHDKSEVGLDYWNVFPNTGTGFGSSQQWTLPTTFEEPIRQLEGTGQFTWTITDLVGSGAVDLVLTGAEADETLGTERWLVHPGEAGGFSDAPINLLLPAEVGHDWATVNGTATVEGGERTWVTQDLNGDANPDILVYSDTSNDAQDWTVYPGGTEGFDAGINYGLPAPPAGETGSVWDSLDGKHTLAAGGTLRWKAVQLMGTESPDFVVLQDDSGEVADAQGAHWSVFACE